MTDLNEGWAEVREEHSAESGGTDLREMLRELVQEYLKNEGAATSNNPTSPDNAEELRRQIAELSEQRERMLSAMRAQQREQAIRDELGRAGVANVNLAFRAMQNEIQMDEDGCAMAVVNGERLAIGEYVRRFVSENPELLPARLSGGAGAPSGSSEMVGPDINSIRPGMSEEELVRVRAEISKLAALESIRKV